jgi:hypothetical protein
MRAPTVSHRPALAEAALTVVVVAVALGLTAIIAGRSTWYSDDFVLLQDAARGRYDLGYLGSVTIAHFSPADRLITLLLYRHAGVNHDVALAAMLAFQAAGIVLVQRIMRWWGIPVAWSAVAAFAFGVSPIVFGSVEWFSAGIMVVPPTALALAAIHGYLCWYRSRRWGWLAWSVVAVAGALLFFEKAALIPVVLVLMRVLLLDEGHPVFDGARILRAEWRQWASYGLVVAVWFVAYRTRPYADTYDLASLGATLDFFRLAWLENLVPAAFGVRVTSTADAFARSVAVVGGQLLVVAAIVTSVRRRTGAWRAWTFVAVAFLLHNALLLPRVHVWGAEQTAHVLRYQLDVLALIPLALAAAFGSRAGSHDLRPRRGLPRWASAGLAAALAAAIGAAAASSASAITDESPGVASKRWLANFRADAERLRPPGATLNILDGTLPPNLLAWWIKPGAQALSLNLPLFAPRLTFDQAVDPIYRVVADGHLRRVAFRQLTGGSLPGPIPGASVRTEGATSQSADGGVCLDATGGEFASLTYRPSHQLRGGPWYLRLSYTTTPKGLFVATDRGVPGPWPTDRGLPSAPIATTRLVSLGEVPGLPLKFGGLRVDVPPGNRACFSRLEVGAFVPPTE